MPDFRSVTVKPIESVQPNGAKTPTQKALDVLSKIEVKPQEQVQTATPAPTVEPEKKDERFANAVGQERKLQRAREQIRKDREDLDAQRKQVEAQRLRPQEYTRNPLAVLQDAFPGLDPAKAYQMLTDAIVADGKPPPELEAHAVRQEVTDLRSQIEKDKEERAAAEKKRQEEEYQAAVTDVKAGIREHVEAHKDAYPYFLAGLEGEADAAGNTLPPHEYVYSVMDAVYKKSLEDPEVKAGNKEPIILTELEAAQRCEAFFKSKFDRLAKLQQTPAPKVAAPAAPSLGGAPPPAPGTSKRKTSADRVAAAIAAIPD